MEPLIGLVLTLVIIGVILYLLQQIPMDATIATVIRVVIILAAVLYLLRLLGLYGGPLFRTG